MADEALLSRALILIVVAFAITIGVYGVVALIVKMDDVGLKLAQTREGAAATFGRGLVRAMPVVLTVLTVVGIGCFALVCSRTVPWAQLTDTLRAARRPASAAQAPVRVDA